MALYLAFLKAVGKAALNAVGGGFAGDVIVDVLPEVAKKVYQLWGAGKSPAEKQAELEALAHAPPAEFNKAVEQAVAEVGRGKPAEIKERLGIYLSLVPGAVRASLRRAGGPEEMELDDADGLLPLLPSHLPRFKPGDRPLPGIDWELEELLGSGGFGEVWKAKNPHFDGVPPVALKFCLDPDAKDRLLRHEAAILNQVMRQGRHPGIVHLQHTYLSADPPCLEYEYVSGGDLAGLISSWQRTPPGAERIARLIHELAEIVAFAHGLSPPIVHRDLKPANILLAPPSPPNPLSHTGERGSKKPKAPARPSIALLPPLPCVGEGGWGGEGMSLRVADFGIGGLAASHARAISVRGVTQGNFLVSALRGAHTPLYASPQQMRGDEPDPRDDVYSIGVIWYQILSGNLTTGRPGGTRWTGRLTSNGVPDSHVELLSACLEDEPSDRPDDADMLAESLRALLDIPAAKPEARPAPAAKPAAKPASPAPLPRTGSPDIEVTDTCPDCGAGMTVRVNKQGGYFLGCLLFPACRGTRRPPPELVERMKAAEAGIAPPPLKVNLARQVVNSIGMRFVLIPAGTFTMGSPSAEALRGSDEGPLRRTRIERPFYLGVYPVTQKQYEAVMKDNPSHFHKKNGGGPEHPVEQVSWDDCVAFCKKLSSLTEEKKEGRGYRLPTEAEWEYACRAGTETPFSFGDTLGSDQANFDGNRPYGDAEVGPFLQRTARVGCCAANVYGLYDMHGNVWEWCADWYTLGSHRVLRGGSWNNSGHLCRSARRQKYAPDFRGDNVGFRVVLEA